jgi:hypothetical protein
MCKPLLKVGIRDHTEDGRILFRRDEIHVDCVVRAA